MACLLSFNLAVLAQTKSVRGTVLDEETGEPIIGASVRVKGETVGTTTDENGQFTLSVPESATTLLITYVGMTPVETPIKKNMEIHCTCDNRIINDVVVVAYGQQKRKDLTSAIASVKSDELKKVPATSVEEAMKGKMAGVQITQTSGQPGAGISINVRGTSSISAGNEPLWVIDGMPVISNDMEDYRQSSIADINPSDIASIEVLKDASASALYGSRASNGVILVTTKRGALGQKTRVTLDSYVSVQNMWKKYDMLDATSLISAYNEGIDNYNKSYGLTPTDANYQNHIAAHSNSNTNWVDEITRNAVVTSHQLAVQGGNQKTSFYLSGGYYYQQGVMKQTDYNRYNLRSNLSHHINKKLTVEANLALSSSTNDYTAGDGSIFSPWRNALRISPDYAPYNADGTYASVNSDANPVAVLDKDSYKTRKYRLLGNLKGILDILPGLKYNLNLGGDYNLLHYTDYIPADSPSASHTGEAEDRRIFTITRLIENTLTYNHNFGEKLQLGGLLGYSYQKTSYDTGKASGTDFASTSLHYITSASNTQGSTSLEENALSSYFGRMTFNFMDRYLLEASLRADGSSKFDKDERWGWFPAASLAWRPTQEAFFADNKYVNDLKIRASVGLTGNQEGIDNYLYHTVFVSDDWASYNNLPGYSLSDEMPNKKLTWEKTLQTGFGVDFSLFNNHLDGSLDFFWKNTTDLLLTHTANALSGYSAITENVGAVKNHGIELSMTSHNITRKNFQWNTTLNFTYAVNKVTKLVPNAAGEEADIPVGNCNVMSVGEPMSSFFLIRQDGIYQSDSEVPTTLYDKGVRAGDVKYYDLDGDGDIDEDDRVVSGSPFPKIFGSLNNTFSYKNFDLSVDLQYSFGGKIYADWKAGLQGMGSLGGNGSFQSILKSEYENRWTSAGSSDDTPRLVAYGTDGYAATYNSYASTRYLQNADFLRISNITLGYTLPRTLTKKAHIERLRFYATANNLYTFTGYEGLDPEATAYGNPSNGGGGFDVGYRGNDYGSIPALRSFTFGFNVTF